MELNPHELAALLRTMILDPNTDYLSSSNGAKRVAEIAAELAEKRGAAEREHVEKVRAIIETQAPRRMPPNFMGL